MTLKTILGVTKPALLALVVVFFSPTSRGTSSTTATPASKIGPGGARQIRYLVKQVFYKVRSGSGFANLSDPLPLNDFIEDLGNRIGRKRIVAIELEQPQCTEEDPCEQVWFREEPDPAHYGMEQMLIWLQREPAIGNHCEYVTPKEIPLREPVVSGGEEGAQMRLLKGAAIKLSSYDQHHNSTGASALPVAE
jgi:hypothetical protein